MKKFMKSQCCICGYEILGTREQTLYVPIISCSKAAMARRVHHRSSSRR